MTKREVVNTHGALFVRFAPEPQVECLAAENRILRAHTPARLRLSDAERSTLAQIGKRLGHKGLAKVAQVAKPETILGWFGKLVAHKFDGSKHRPYPGRPKIDSEVERLIVQMARENSGCRVRKSLEEEELMTS